MDPESFLYSTSYYLAYQAGHKNLTKFITEQNTTFISKPGMKFAALFDAVQAGQIDKFETCMEDCKGILRNQIDDNHIEFFDKNENNIDFLYNNRQTALSSAAEHGLHQLASLLIKMGANVNTTDSNGWSPIHHAAKNGKQITMELLIKNGVNINVVTNKYETCLILAARHGQKDVVKMLLKKNADINMTDENQKNAMQYAASNGHGLIVLMFLQQGLNFPNTVKLVNAACESEKTNVLEIIFTEIPNIRLINWWGLHTAVYIGNAEIVQMLLEKGMDINIQNDKKRTSLFITAFTGNTEMAKMLLDKGANLHIEDFKGWTVIHYAAERGHIEIVKLFIDYGLHVNIKTNGSEETPLTNAAKSGHIEMVKFLLKKGADKTIQDHWGKTAKYHARKNGHENIAELLKGRLNLLTIRRKKLFFL